MIKDVTIENVRVVLDVGVMKIILRRVRKDKSYYSTHCPSADGQEWDYITREVTNDDN